MATPRKNRKKKATKKKKKRTAPHKPLPLGTLRIRTKDLAVVAKTHHGWQTSRKTLAEAQRAIKLFKAHHTFASLIDIKDPHFLKGMLLPNGLTRGARIPFLPDGRKLDKAFSLFAPELAIHDQLSNQHWDVLYKNPGGTYSYVYTLEKKQRMAKKKYREVDVFAQHYRQLHRNVARALHNDKDLLALPMYTLLKTCMRIGNETYYRAHGHKGLTTLKKHDIEIDGNWVTFHYLSKNGVPVRFTERFPDSYVVRLSRHLEKLDEHAFVFANPTTGHPLHEEQFKEAFVRYCGEAFYPHIVRSYYATQYVRDFVQRHQKPSKQEVRALLKEVAAKLGHKRYVQKEHDWKEDYKVTISHYIEPRLAEQVRDWIR